MDGMFNSISLLISINFSNFKTLFVENFNNLLNGKEKIKYIDISGSKTNKERKYNKFIKIVIL